MSVRILTGDCRTVLPTLPGFEEAAVKGADIVLTPDDVARDVVRRFAPTGRVLDPCKGEGAFLRHMPGALFSNTKKPLAPASAIR